MSDLIFSYNLEQKCFDLDLEKTGNNTEQEFLESLLGMILFTNCRCESWELPQGEEDTGGWFADNFGSKLWTVLNRGKITNQLLDKITNYTNEALDILVPQYIKNFKVTVDKSNTGVSLLIEVTSPTTNTYKIRV